MTLSHFLLLCMCVGVCPWSVPVSCYDQSLIIPAAAADYSGEVKPSIYLSLPICSQGEASVPRGLTPSHSVASGEETEPGRAGYRDK